MRQLISMLCLPSTLVIAITTSTSLLAQEETDAQPTQIADESSKVEEKRIVVTAQRRPKYIDEVPVAITALSASDLELKQIDNVLDLQYQVPNISIATNTGTANGARIFLRGVGEDESRPSADPAVGIYVDGIYVGRQVGALLDLVDLERVEVLRGPQGTLYGRNSNGGAIKLISKKPQMTENYGVANATFGSDGRLNARLTGNIALSEFTAMRATVLSKNRDGFHTLNPNGDFANQAGTEVGQEDTQAFRVSFLHDFSLDWSANLSLDYTNNESDPVPDSAAPGNDADNDLFTIEPLPGTVCSAATPANFLALGCFTDYSSKAETQGMSLNINGDIGDYDLVFLTGYRELEDDLSSRIGFPYLQQTNQDQLSQEISLVSNYDGPFNFVAGLYYFSEDIQMDSVFVFPFFLGIETDAVAVFFQSDYAFEDSMTLTTGLRYTDETKDLDASAAIAPLPDGSQNPAFARGESRDFTNTTFNIALRNQFTDDVTGYASYSTGFKSGGWSPDCFSPVACFLPVDEEELDSLEFGILSSWMDNRLRFNVTYFFNMYDNLQIAASVPDLGFTRFNVSETEINGLELELLFEATENLTLDITFGTLDGEYTKLTLQQAGGLTNNGSSSGCNGVVSIECALDLELKNAPEYKGTFGIAHKTGLADGSLITRIDFSFEDDSYSLVANAPEHSLTSVDTLINARVGYEPSGGDWMVALWGKNLTDEEYSRVSTGGSFTQYAAEPLEWGIDLQYRF